MQIQPFLCLALAAATTTAVAAAPDEWSRRVLVTNDDGIGDGRRRTVRELPKRALGGALSLLNTPSAPSWAGSTRSRRAELR